VVHRIFLSLACVAVVLLLANGVVGLIGGDYNAACHGYLKIDRAYDLASRAGESTEKLKEERAVALKELQRHQPYMTAHTLLGVVASLVTVLVNSISVTYFVGTSKWSGEVVETYKLPKSLADESARVKRRSFPWAVIGMLTIVVIITLGAASDPSAMNHVHSAKYVQTHMLVALSGIALIIWAFIKQAECLSAHAQVIEKIMTEVRRVRMERGLDVETTE
jgi:hypothetical protein